jgi:hypothetical protein
MKVPRQEPASSPVVGTSVKLRDMSQVYWNDGRAWYAARVMKQWPHLDVFWLEYLDHVEGEWLDLAANGFRRCARRTKNDAVTEIIEWQLTAKGLEIYFTKV